MCVVVKALSPSMLSLLLHKSLPPLLLLLYSMSIQSQSCQLKEKVWPSFPTFIFSREKWKKKKRYVDSVSVGMLSRSVFFLQEKKTNKTFVNFQPEFCTRVHFFGDKNDTGCKTVLLSDKFILLSCPIKIRKVDYKTGKFFADSFADTTPPLPSTS